MNQNKNRIIEQALLQAFQETQAAEPQEEPVFSPGFRERMQELNRQYLQQKARRRTQLRRWTCAAAAAIVIGTVGLTSTYHWVVRRNRPETLYTIRQLPGNHTQVLRETGPHTSFTVWEADGNHIILVQEENSLVSLMAHQPMYTMKQKVHVDGLDGQLYVNFSDGRKILVWQDGKYFFLLTMEGALNRTDQLIRTAKNLKVTVL